MSGDEDADLFSWGARYPASPGSKVAGPSAEAADDMASEAATLRRRCLECLLEQELTADEVAAKIGRSILSIRPRLSELRTLEKIEDSGLRRNNLSGKRATVWRRVR